MGERLRDALAIAALAAVGLAAAGLAFLLIVRFLPLLAALVLALIVALILVGVLVAVFGFFASAAGALYYALKRPPEEEPGPQSLDRARELDKRRGKFEGREEEEVEV